MDKYNLERDCGSTKEVFANLKKCSSSLSVPLAELKKIQSIKLINPEFFKTMSRVQKSFNQYKLNPELLDAMTKAQNVISTMKNNPLFIEIERTAKQMELLQKNITAQIQCQPIVLDYQLSAEKLNINNYYFNSTIDTSLTQRIFSTYSNLRFPEIKEISLDNVPEINEAIINNRLVFEKIGSEILSSPAYKERATQTQAIIEMNGTEGNIALDYLMDKKTEAPLDKTITKAIQKHIDSIINIPIVKIFLSVTTVAMAISFWAATFSPYFKGPATVFPFCEPQVLPLFNEQVPAVTYFIGGRYYYEAPIIIGNNVLNPLISDVASKDIEAKSADITEDK
ncbi:MULTISPECIES: hypothetical protein [Synergistaceae]|uniref:hypothetical protein n=1 Tax=Synergistaceae TaxID=649777 RepID=UPI003AE5562E|nr:hypothetical protein [Synergistaceae bacterium DZ-S4]